MADRPHLNWEQRWWKRGVRAVAGVDEAGRGPLAGPVVAAAVILAPETSPDALETLTDSKQMTPAQRERLFDQIQTVAWGIAVARVEPPEIDRINILQASLKAMALALCRLEPRPEAALIDGRYVPTRYLPPQWNPDLQAVVGGDRISLSIAAASVVAKVTRDRIMEAYDREYPEYGFARHKGYPSPEHRQAIARYGVTPIHRKTFRGVREYCTPGLLPPRNTTQRGRAAEIRAARHLEGLGWRILDRNVRTPHGELDLIAMDGEQLVFVEVKARRTGRYGAPAEAVSSLKQKRLTAAALWYLQEQGDLDRPARFDVLVIQGSRLRLIRNAFPANWENG